MRSTSRKIRVLLWKSYHLRIYNWKTTLVEALVPIIIALYVSWVISKYSHEGTSTHPTSYKSSFDRTNLLAKIHPFDTIAYTPSCPFVEDFLKQIIADLQSITTKSPDLKSYENEDALEEYLIKQEQYTLYMGIVFPTINTSDCESAPDYLTYELRQTGVRDTRSVYPASDKSGPYPNKGLYLDSGFAAFLLIMNENFIKMKTKNTNWKMPNTEFQPFPYPEFETSPVPRDQLAYVVCFCLIITLLALSVPFINHVTEEKGNGTKALMMVHGVEEWVIWLCWFIHAIMVLIISLTIMTILLKYPMSGEGTEPFRYVPFAVLWLMFILYCIANMSFSFMFCAIFQQGTYAAFMYVLVSAVEIFINICLTYLHINRFPILFCLFPSTAFTRGFEMILFFEEIGNSHPWKSIAEPRDHNSPVSLLIAMLMLFVDIILYAFLTYYISNINPGKYGIKKSPLYFLESLIPTLKSSGSKVVKDDNEWEENYEYIQLPLPGEQPSMQIKDLYKEYGSIYAVNGVDMEIYENGITVILGHNGAGKTTLLGIIAGLIAPDSGSITYKDMDVIENQEEFRENLGVSFQDDRLFPYLTVRNHLLFYGMLKGLYRSEASEEAENYLSRMEMYDDQNSWIKNISDIEKRKLSFMISLMGDSKILILDQPTFGMDLQSKTAIWDFLMDIREGRTIISTARDMHDAEKIASRIAIMESGVLVSYGTIAFLKKTFGAAYELSVTTKRGYNHNVANFVKNYIPHTVIKHDVGNEIIFKLQSSETARFPKFFEDLENIMDSYDISNFELGYTTLEQILLEIGSLSKAGSTEIENINLINESQYVEPQEGYELTRLQLKTLFKKKIIYTKRTYMYTVTRMFLPVLMILLVVRIVELHDFSPIPELDLSLIIYPGATVELKNTNAALNSKQLELYADYVKKKNCLLVIISDENVVEQLLEFGRENIIQFRKKVVLALEFGQPNRVLYNQWMLHSFPIAITTYTNMLLRDALGTDKVEVRPIIHPIPNVEFACLVAGIVDRRNMLLIMTFFVFSFLTADILLYHFEFSSTEIARSFMHIQIISKVPIGIYWFTIFAFDFIFFVIIVIIRIFVFYLIDNAQYFITFGPPFHILFIIMLLFGVGGLFFIYVLSLFLSPSKETLIKLYVLNFLCNVGIYCYFIFLDVINDVIGDFFMFLVVIEKILLLIPIVNFGFIVIRYIFTWFRNDSCNLCVDAFKQACFNETKFYPYFTFTKSPQNPDGLLLEFIFLIVHIFLYFILLWLISTGVFGRIYRAFFRNKSIEIDKNDDVKQERNNILEIKESESKYLQIPLLVDGLNKYHIKSFQPFLAVEDVSFIAQDGMCFGILGVDGSGKTSTLKMLSTEMLPTNGDASILGISLSENKNVYISMIGYCPQTNPLLDELTGKEMLRLIASLRGISGYDAEMLIDLWISYLNLEKYQDKTCGSYSDGSKRKLCTAIALIGNPKVVFLDEPTTDLDPISTRRLHDIIRKCKEAGVIVVLASPNMEECEILCDRLTILVHGVMYCIGTPKELKKNYALGFVVSLKIDYDVNSLDEILALEETMMNTFDERYCELIEEQRGLLRYHISDPSMVCSLLFRNLEEIKNNNPVIDEYVATNTTLEDVFITVSQPSEYDADSSEFD